LTVETEANGDSRNTYERVSFLGWFAGLFLPVHEIFYSALSALVGQYKIFLSSTENYFTSFVSIAQQAGQAVMPCRLSLNISGTYNRHSVSSYVPHFFKTLYTSQNYIFISLCDCCSIKMCFHVRNACS
jgi:hypothetical protein